MKKDDVYIAILKYAKDNLDNGATFTDVKKYLKQLGYSFEPQPFQDLFSRVFSDPSGHNYVMPLNVNIQKFIMGIEAYFQLLEYEELKEARQSSKNAMWIAIVAIIISAGLAFASIILGLVQIFKA